jgi:hypothetical protein
MVEPVSMAVFLTTLASAAGSAAGEAAVSQSLQVLRELTGLQDDQQRMLRAIDLKVDALLSGPFFTGQRQLEDALTAWRDEEDRRHLLKEARSSFTAALGQDPEPLRRSFAGLHLVSIWLALGSIEDAVRWLREAHFAALHALVIEKNRKYFSGSLQERRKRAYEVGPGAKGARQVREITPYANGLAEARRNWGAARSDAPLVIGLEGDDLTKLRRKVVLREMVPQLSAYDEARQEELYPNVLDEVRNGEILFYQLIATWLEMDPDDRPLINRGTE